LSHREIIAWLTEEDLVTSRRIHGRATIAHAGNPNMTVDKSLQAIIDDAENERYIRREYQIPDDENFLVSMVDGAIYESEEPS
jgi:hypothetical protein